MSHRVLTEEELHFCVQQYEKITGRSWLPVVTEEQRLWVTSFEEAKKHFEAENKRLTQALKEISNAGQSHIMEACDVVIEVKEIANAALNQGDTK